MLILYMSGLGSILAVENGRQEGEPQTFKCYVPGAGPHVKYEKTSKLQFLQSPYKV